MPFKEKSMQAAEEMRHEEKRPIACVDCIHCIKHPNIGLEDHFLCVNPSIPVKFDMVTGKKLANYCALQRTGECGKEAKFFERRFYEGNYHH